MKGLINFLIGTALIFAMLVQFTLAANESDLIAMAESGDIINCAQSFIGAYSSLGSVGDGEKAQVTAYYSGDFTENYMANQGGTDPNTVDVLVNLGEQGYYLQYYYLANNTEGLGAKEQLDNAGDGSAWSSVHAQCHPLLRTELEMRDLYDVFIVSLDGDVVYTVFKETDIATNLVSGSFAGTGLGNVFQEAIDLFAGEAAVSTVEPYWPSYNADAQFIGTPIYNGGELLGVIALQITPEQIANGNVLAPTESDALVN